MEKIVNSTPEVTFLEGGMVKFNSGQLLKSVHAPAHCSDRKHCPIHSPSSHHLRGAQLYFNGKHMVRRVGGELFIDPDDYLYGTEKEAILRNSAFCRKCGDMVISTHQHDLSHCSCETVWIDGGNSYIRRMGNPDEYIDTSVIVGARFCGLLFVTDDLLMSEVPCNREIHHGGFHRGVDGFGELHKW